MTIATELPNDLNSITLCSANTYKSVFVPTFTNATVCNSYAQAPVLGAPSGMAYSNCSAASYCISFNSPLAGSIEGFSLTAVTAQQFYAATLEFPTAGACMNAQTQGAFYCVYGTNVCNDTSLIIDGCSSGFGSSFSIPVGEILAFDFLPFSS
jgi:hypothetical protein